jgi:pyruvate formate lyase activating enzyme
LIKGFVFDIKRFSIHDGPGIRTTIFFKGCPLNCWWCHNPESQASRPERVFRANRCIRCGACLDACEQHAISWRGDDISTDEEVCILCGDCVEICNTGAREIAGQERTVKEVMTEIVRDVPFYDQSGGGATFSGGEPLLQKDFLYSLLRSCKGTGIHTALDTCGYSPWKILDDLHEYVDLYLYDLKFVDDSRHREFTGVSNEVILGNLQALSERGYNIFLRVPVIPGVNDDDENISQIGAFAASLPHLDRLDILPYHHAAVYKHERMNKICPLPKTRPPSDGRMLQVTQTLKEFGIKVKMGG